MELYLSSGPDHMGLIVCPETGIELDGWSLLEGEPLAGPEWHGRKTYFVYYAYAADPKPWVFHLDFKVVFFVERSTPRRE